ncbi:GNAT family N-acetyltransferase [Mycetocola sp.]|uniref:GNAT family N-acetyltransferase n=1 Tax=Mycetocola sp. TaxID=1871042 RepID=UPI00398A454F
MTNFSAAQEPRLLRNAAENRYEIWLDESRAGVASFRETDTQVTFIHTIVDEAFGGRGLGSSLAAFALQDTVDRGKRIVPVCPFISEYLESHHEFDEHINVPKRVRS